MISVINTPPVTPPAVICDFGWYYGVSPARLPEYAYTIGGNQYPPGKTILGSNVTLPSTTVASGFSSLAALQASFPSQGVLVLNNGTSHQTVTYTGLATLSGSSSSGVQGFTGCSGGTGAFSAGAATALYDPRFYVDSMPLGLIITFDATDHNGLGLPVVQTPQGVSIVSYLWDLGNGTVGYGPQTSITYLYSNATPSIQATLTVIDSLGRIYSCAHQLNLIGFTPTFGVVFPEVGGQGPFNGSLTPHGSLLIKHGGTNNFYTFNPTTGGFLSPGGTLTTVKSGP